MAYSEMLPIMRTSLLCNPAGHGLIVWAVEMDIGAWLASPFPLPIQTETPAPWDGIFSLLLNPSQISTTVCLLGGFWSHQVNNED